jgi:hypothetical protein
MLGGTNCGKVPYKDRESLTPEQQVEQRTIRCYRLVYGLVSFKGKLADNSDHKVDNLPALYRVSGTAFLPVSNAIKSLKDSGKLMFKCTLKLDTERQKKGGNTYYVPLIQPNSNTNLEFSEKDNETLSIFKQSIDAENQEVIEAYKKARNSSPNAEDVESAKIVDELDDKLPEDILSA